MEKYKLLMSLLKIVLKVTVSSRHLNIIPIWRLQFSVLIVPVNTERERQLHDCASQKLNAEDLNNIEVCMINYMINLLVMWLQM